ncbi:MAG TPA: ABC transporter substrate-binding protein [Acetobacteraceae bacterium]|jgi:polar amino acid transport system substrate-binding protein|nr:ABC transporter substrate-binding protein [Acetobacteraceae bacterium]
MRKHLICAAGAVLAVMASGTAHAAGPDAKLRAMLPASILQAGEVKVGTDPENPPYDFYGPDHQTMVGLEQDLQAELASRLGVKFTTYPAPFASIIPGIQAGRFDIGLSAFGDFGPREKILDVIDYTLEGTSMIVVKGNPHHATKISDVCGLTAGAVQGSIPLQLLDKQKGLCPADKPLTVLQFPSNDQVKAAMKSGRVDVSMDTTGVAAYSLAHQPPEGVQLELVPGAKYAVGYQGILVGKDDPQLRDAIVATLHAMIADGTYDSIFKKWGLAENEVKQITVDDAARYADYMKLN